LAILALTAIDFQLAVSCEGSVPVAAGCTHPAQYRLPPSWSSL